MGRFAMEWALRGSVLRHQMLREQSMLTLFDFLSVKRLHLNDVLRHIYVKVSACMFLTGVVVCGHCRVVRAQQDGLNHG